MNSVTKKIIFFLLSAGVLFCVCSCVSETAAKETRPHVWLTDKSKYILLPPESIEVRMDMPQLVSASYGGQDYFINAWVQADETGITMTMVNELGANMGELSYRSGAVSFSSPVFPPSLGTEYIVADFQLCFYSVPALRAALADCGLLFETTETARRVLQGKKVIIEITKSGSMIKLVNHLRGYAYTLEGDFE